MMNYYFAGIALVRAEGPPQGAEEGQGAAPVVSGGPPAGQGAGGIATPIVGSGKGVVPTGIDEAEYEHGIEMATTDATQTIIHAALVRTGKRPVETFVVVAEEDVCSGIEDVEAVLLDVYRRTRYNED